MEDFEFYMEDQETEKEEFPNLPKELQGIDLNPVSIEIADTYLYSIKIKGYPHKVLWSEEYAKEHAGYIAWVDLNNKDAPIIQPDTTKKIYKAIKAIKALAKCGELI